MLVRLIYKVGLLSLLAFSLTACFDNKATSGTADAESTLSEDVSNSGAENKNAETQAVEAETEIKPSSVNEEGNIDITARLKKAIPQAEIASVSESPVAGLYAVEVVGNGIIYMSQDGEHFIAGDLYRVGPKGLSNVTEEKMNSVRAKALLAVKSDQMITFPAQGEEKAKLTVFTDIDCGYCRKFHKEVPDLNAMGISVSYMAFPRAGIGSSSFNKYVSVWCSDDQQASMNDAKLRKPIEPKMCENPVQEQYLLGQQVGVNSTPNLVTEDGELIRGYVPAQQLAQRLGVN